ncbi:MAG TPA: DUF2889 domain-containing protein [Acidimicrobiia bacterium]|nr:DUF2889 domain-containing protein [Acidimicrobiia bacterium]
MPGPRVPTEPFGNPSQWSPTRVPGSIRRTSNLDMWSDPDDRSTMWLRCRARDLLTAADSEAHVLGAARLDVRTGANRVVEEIRADPTRDGLEYLVGQRGGSGFRKQIDVAVPGEREAGSLLFYLLDDLPAAALIGGYVWSRFDTEGRERAQMPSPPRGSNVTAPSAVAMENVCAGWETAGTPMRLMTTGRPPIGPTVVAPDLVPPDDPLAWHDLGELPVASMRRRRRVDVFDRPGGDVTVDAMFRDSCRTPDGVEVAVHEYTMRATVDPGAAVLTSITAEPRVLPFVECPSAAGNVDRLLGLPLAEFRTTVLETLRGTDCCTHLNDALRALAEVPVLVEELTRLRDTLAPPVEP